MFAGSREINLSYTPRVAFYDESSPIVPYLSWLISFRRGKLHVHDSGMAFLVCLSDQ